MMATENVISEMARDREARAAQAHEMTIQQAIDEAEWLRRTPDGVIDKAKLRLISVTLLAALERSTCYLKAMKAGQEVFVLRQHDRAAPAAIRGWAGMAAAHGAAKKAEDAFGIAARWESQSSDETKWPD